MTGLAFLFQRTAEVLRANRDTLNQADPYNGDHGDHMLEIFEIASQAASEKGGESLADIMEYASQLLRRCEGNATAVIYAQGLAQFGLQIRKFGVTQDELIGYIGGVLADKDEGTASSSQGAGEGSVLKALLTGLAGWRAVAQGKEPPAGSPDTGYLFDLGVAYMQAKARGGSKPEILANAAISASPLSEPPYRARSGRLVIQTILEAFAEIG